MIGSGALPAPNRIGAIGEGRTLTGRRVAEIAWSLLSRLLLALFLAAVAALIPGEATQVLETRLTWSDVFHRRPLGRPV